MMYNKVFNGVKGVMIVAMLFMLSATAFAQKAQLEKLSEIKGVQYQHFDKNAMQQAMDNDFDLELGDFSLIPEGKKGDILKKLDEIYVLTTEEKSAGKKLSKGARKILKGKEFTSMLNLGGDEGGRVQICTAEENGKKVLAILVNSDDDETVFIILKGTIDMSKLSEGMISNVM
ncbi:MAG: DUF4252 domain-containing protein [Bacteroidaceae bacterium]|nr:DUF4252 domain-containing protein [Bacteroidaceae bacterium]